MIIAGAVNPIGTAEDNKATTYQFEYLQTAQSTTTIGSVTSKIPIATETLLEGQSSSCPFAIWLTHLQAHWSLLRHHGTLKTMLHSPLTFLSFITKQTAGSLQMEVPSALEVMPSSSLRVVRSPLLFPQSPHAFTPHEEHQESD
jgi:hypothetical protein